MGRRLSLSPFARTNVTLNERHHLFDDGITHELRNEAEAGTARHGEVPRVFVFVLVVLLLDELFEQHRHQSAESGPDEVENLHIRLSALDGVRTTELLLANRAPKLDGLQTDFALVLFGR